MRRTAGAAVLVLGVLGGEAAAHDYRLLRAGEKDPRHLAHDLLLPNRYTFYVRKSDEVRLTVANNSQPVCTARINPILVTGTTATISDGSGEAFVEDQEFTIRATAIGTTTFRIAVVGVDVSTPDVQRCEENSENDVVVVVQSDEEFAVREAAEAWRTAYKGLKFDFKAYALGLGQELRTDRDDVKRGSVPPLTGTWNLMDSYFLATKEARDRAQRATDEFRAACVALLVAGSFAPSCEPRGFSPGHPGIWSLSLLQTAAIYQAFEAKLTTGLAKDVTFLEKSYGTPARPFLVTADILGDGFRPRALFPTTSSAFTPRTGSGLDLLFAGGVSTVGDDGNSRGYAWLAGCSDPAKGDLRIDALGGDGSTGSWTVAPDANGVFRILLDTLVAGLAYRLSVQYASGSGGYGDKCYLSLPWVDPTRYEATKR